MSSKKKRQHQAARPTPTPGIITVYHAIAIAAVVITPLLLSRSFAQMFEFPKEVFVYGLALLAVLATAVDAYRQKRWLHIQTLLDWPLVIFLSLAAIATVLSIDWYVSLVGYYSRFNGSLISYVSTAILLYVVSMDLTYAVEDDGKDRSVRRRQLLWAMVFTSGVVAALGVLFYWGADPLCLWLNGTLSRTCWDAQAQVRSFSTLGQPNNLGAYLVVTIPISLSLLMTAKEQWARLVSLAIVILSAGAMVYTLSRAAWLGLAAALVIFGLCLSWSVIRQRLPWLVAGLVAVVVVAALSLGPITQRASETVTTAQAAASTSATRLLIWQGAVKVIQQHPFIGTGPETFVYSFLPYRSRDLNDTTEWNAVYDKAHNEVLQVATGMGIPAALIWIWMVLLLPVLYALVNIKTLMAGRLNGFFDRLHLPQRLSESRVAQVGNWLKVNDQDQASFDPIITGGLLASLVGLFATLLLGFSTIELSVLTMVILAVLVSPNSKVSVRIAAAPSRLAAVVLAGVSAVGIFVWGRYVYADYVMQQSQTIVATGDVTTAVQRMQQATSLNPYERVYRLAYSYGLGLQAVQSEDIDQQTALRQQAETQAHHALRQGAVGEVVMIRAINTFQLLSQQDQTYLPRLSELLEQGMRLVPTSANLANEQSRHALAHMDQDAAWAAVERVMELRPQAGDSYIRRAAWYQQYGSKEMAIRDLETTLTLSPIATDPTHILAKKMLDELQTQQ